MFDKKNSILTIFGEQIHPGESKELNFDVANLHTSTPVNIPLIIERSDKPGPTVLFTAGIHGDEVNGVEIVRQLIEKGINKPKRGTIICMPVINVFGFINLKREFPDGRDLNRVFPGGPSGSLAGRVAHKLVEDVIPHTDVIIDFHTGGSGRFNAPQIRYAKENKYIHDLAKAFEAPFILYSKNLPNSFRSTCLKLKKPMLLFEGGKSFHIDDMVTLAGLNGSMRVLKYLGMLSATFKTTIPKTKTVVISESKWVRANYSGMFKAVITVGAYVEKHAVIGQITDPYGKFNHAVKAPNAGHIINVNEYPIVYQGNALFHISTKLKN